MFYIRFRDEDGTHYLESAPGVMRAVGVGNVFWSSCKRDAMRFHTKAFADCVAARVEEAMRRYPYIRSRVCARED
jgi:hypothetical protein